jgi:hypothetical protein
VDQREWDAGARLPRDRHATDTWSPQQSSESPEKPQSGTVADTGSLQPSPEALAWTQRAEAWAQQSPGDEEQSAGPLTYSVDGVGWRTEAAEWLAAEQTARWRQTTEWRSASGDHGWRSTTEAWQTGGNAEGFRPPADRPLAISSTAWSADQPAGDPEPAQTYSTTPQTFTTHGSPPGWQQFNGGAPAQSAPDSRPAWQQFAASTPPWQAPVGTPAVDPPHDNAYNADAPSVDRAETVSTPPWQRVVPPPPVDPANTAGSPPWQQSVAMPAQRNGGGTSWQQLVEPPRPGTYASSGSAGNGATPWRVPDPPDQPWRAGAVGVAGVGDGRAGGRRRAPEEEPPGTAWDPSGDDDRADAPTWRDWTDAPGARHAERSGRRDDAEPPSRHRSDAPRWAGTDDGGDWDNRPQNSDPGWRDRSDGWRSEPDSGSWSRGEEPRTVNWRRRRVEPDDDTDAPGWRDAGPHTDGWRRDVRPAADPWAQHAPDTGFIPMSWDEPGAHAGSWRSDPEDRADRDYRARRRAGDGPPLDPAVWRRARERPDGGANWPADDSDEYEYAERPPVGEAATEVRRRIDPETWQRGPREPGQPARGATYRGGNSGDWRRELAGETDLADGEARRFGTQDFVPFRPAGSTPAPAYGPPEPPSAPVGKANGARWHDPPDTQWPPRAAVPGSYQRQAADSMATSGRFNLLEPEDDLEDNSRGGPLAAVGYTIIWYGVPVVLFVLYMLIVTGDEKAHALSTLANAAPQFGLSLALSMLVAVLLRWISGSWKAASVGLAAAVMGGGLATVLTSAITGTSLS